MITTFFLVCHLIVTCITSQLTEIWCDGMGDVYESSNNEWSKSNCPSCYFAVTGAFYCAQSSPCLLIGNAAHYAPVIYTIQYAGNHNMKTDMTGWKNLVLRYNLGRIQVPNTTLNQIRVKYGCNSVGYPSNIGDQIYGGYGISEYGHITDRTFTLPQSCWNSSFVSIGFDIYLTSGKITIDDVCMLGSAITASPTSTPTIEPTISTKGPTLNPTDNTPLPTTYPSKNPTSNPTSNPTMYPTEYPTLNPTNVPSLHPSIDPTLNPTANPTYYPSINPTLNPTVDPTIYPTIYPTINPTVYPTTTTTTTTTTPTENPTNIPTIYPTYNPTNIPTTYPTSVVESTENIITSTSKSTGQISGVQKRNKYVAVLMSITFSLFFCV